MDVRVRGRSSSEFSDVSINSIDPIIKKKNKERKNIINFTCMMTLFNFIILMSFSITLIYLYINYANSITNTILLLNRINDDYDKIIGNINDITDRANSLLNTFNETIQIIEFKNITFMVQRIYKKIDNNLSIGIT